MSDAPSADAKAAAALKEAQELAKRAGELIALLIKTPKPN